MDEIIKVLREEKKRFTKEYPSPTLIYDVTNYPKVSVIITRGHNKSWGYFHTDELGHIYLGSNNQLINGVMVRYGSFDFDNLTNFVLYSNNSEVSRVYNKLFGLAKNTLFYNQKAETFVFSLLKINPILFTNYWDYGTVNELIIDNIVNSFISLFRCNLSIDLTKPTLKEAFGISKKYFKLIFHRRVDRINFNLVKQYCNKYSYEEVLKYGEAFMCYSGVTDYVDDREIIKCWYNLKNNYLSSTRYIDYLRLRKELPSSVRKKYPKIVSGDNITELHQKCLHDYNLYLNEIRERQALEKQEKYLNNVYKLARLFEYSNDDYSIIACKDLVDLYTEGKELHHCVGSYVDSVSKGNEYILFLRKNNDINTPFFTIDVTPYKKVRQIHGLCNCNITKEIRPFIEEWAKKFNIDLSNCNSICNHM